MKKFVSLFLSCCLFVSLCGIALAADIVQPTLKIQNGRLVDSPDVQYIVDKYFSLRKRAFLLQEREENSIDAIKDISSNREVWEKEEQRLSARDNLAEHHGVHVIDANNSAYVISASFIDNTNLMLDVYEWTWIRYNDGKDGPIDEMGYATDHQIKIEQAIDGSLSIIEDIYDESEIIGGAFIPSEKSILTEVSENSFETKGVNSNIDYEVNAVIDYADTWVIHEYASNMQNFSYYNLSTYGYYSADCANFVSQCMRAGGMQWDYGSGKDNGNWDGTQWWFDINPDPNYENYTVSPPSWRSVSKFIEYWNNQGYASVSASTSSVYPGNPVYVSGHVGICVGYNSSGTPIINAHNRDVYHVPYASGAVLAKDIFWC